jgi:hypothetical protein
MLYTTISSHTYSTELMWQCPLVIGPVIVKKKFKN